MHDREQFPRRAPPVDRAWAGAWQQAARLAHACDRLSRRMDDAGGASLGARLRSAARVVPLQVAVGQGCTRAAERAYHLAVARGALGEVEGALVVLARRLDYLAAEHAAPLLARCRAARLALGRLVAATWAGA
jgi:four helix bundle protein